MTNFILHNAYGILGLTPNATLKDIEKQTKEIEKLLKIGEIPQYSLDLLPHFTSLRNEKNIKEAKQNLLNMDAKILHYFFAIYILSESEREIFRQKMQNLYENDDFSAKTFIEKKNIAIFLYLYMSQKKGVIINIRRYLQLWADILSDENIEKFKKLYKHDDDLGINDSVLNEIDIAIRNKAILLQSALVDFVKDDKIKIAFISNIIRIFNPSDEVLESISLISDIFKRVNNLINTIEKSNDIDTLKSNIEKLSVAFTRLADLGLKNYNQTIMLKDRVAKILRDKSIYFHNEKHNSSGALMLVDKAYNLCGSDFERNQIKKDRDKLKEAVKHNEIAKLLNKAKTEVNAGNFYEYVFDGIANEIRKISPKDSDDYIDQIAIIIGNKAIENANNAQQNLQFFSRSDAIMCLDSIYKIFEKQLNVAKRYAKKTKTREWLNNQMPESSQTNTPRNLANRASGSHTTSDGKSLDWETLEDIFKLIILIAILCYYIFW